MIGGILQTLEMFAACQQYGSIAVVHAWGGAVCLMANYHAAFAGGGTPAQRPLPEFELRRALLVAPLEIKAGMLQIPTRPGLGVQLTPELEKYYAFREEAVYSCRSDPGRLPPASVWQDESQLLASLNRLSPRREHWPNCSDLQSRKISHARLIDFFVLPEHARLYLLVDPEAIKKFRRVVEENLPDLLLKG